MTAPTEQFPIKSGLTGAVMLIAEIECRSDTHPTIKLGLAVKWAVKSRANLWGADLAGANLLGASLSRACFSEAGLAGDKIKRLIAYEHGTVDGQKTA